MHIISCQQKKTPNRCSSHAGGLTGLLLNYEAAKLVVLFRVLQPCIPFLLWQGWTIFSINPKHLNTCQCTKGPFCDFEGFSWLLPQPLGNEPVILSKKCFYASANCWDKQLSTRLCNCSISPSQKTGFVFWVGRLSKQQALMKNQIKIKKNQAIRHILIDLVLLRSSFCFTRRKLPLCQLKLGKQISTAKEIWT